MKTFFAFGSSNKKRDELVVEQKDLRAEIVAGFFHNHGSGKWVPPRLVSLNLGEFSTSMTVGERLNPIAPHPYSVREHGRFLFHRVFWGI